MRPRIVTVVSILNDNERPAFPDLARDSAETQRTFFIVTVVLLQRIANLMTCVAGVRVTATAWVVFQGIVGPFARLAIVSRIVSMNHDTAGCPAPKVLLLVDRYDPQF